MSFQKCCNFYPNNFEFCAVKKNLNISNILISKNTFSGKKNYKYFIGYIDGGSKIKPFHVMLLKISAYRKSYDERW